MSCDSSTEGNSVLDFSLFEDEEFDPCKLYASLSLKVPDNSTVLHIKEPYILRGEIVYRRGNEILTSRFSYQKRIYLVSFMKLFIDDCVYVTSRLIGPFLCVFGYLYLCAKLFVFLACLYCLTPPPHPPPNAETSPIVIMSCGFIKVISSTIKVWKCRIVTEKIINYH